MPKWVLSQGFVRGPVVSYVDLALPAHKQFFVRNRFQIEPPLIRIQKWVQNGLTETVVNLSFRSFWRWALLLRAKFPKFVMAPEFWMRYPQMIKKTQHSSF